MSQQQQPPSVEVGRLLNLIPVGLKEAAIDSPTSRATILHFSEQVELLERWLEEYMKATNRLIAESTTLENILTYFTSHANLPITISESVLDHDYSLLAMKKYSEGAKDFWMSMISVVKRLATLVVEPIRTFLHNDIRAFKDVRRNLEHCQKTFDNLQMKYAALGKTKEPSSLREDAFQLHEARRAYLHASMDFFSLVPQLRFSSDKLIVRIFFDQWREMRISRDNTASTFQRSAAEMERVKGWVREMENSEKSFRRELVAARKQLEDAAEINQRPSRELEDYAVSTVPQIGGVSLQRSPQRAAVQNGEKQGWLYLRTYTGKPTRTLWVKRWAFIRNGIFGWLVQGTRAGGVEESERIGVLLCNVRSAPAEERRFCFEIKTNKNTIFLQAESQSELASWLGTFEKAKSRAVEDPGTTETPASSGHVPSHSAFAISPPPIAEFGTAVLGSTEPGANDESMPAERTNTLQFPDSDVPKENIEGSRRSTVIEREDGARDHSSRIKAKLDLVRKGQAVPQLSASASNPMIGGGIASLIAASHGSMPVGPSIPWMAASEADLTKPKTTFKLALRDMPASTLAPSTLANTPAPTNLSKAAVVVTGERGISGALGKAGIPNSLLANTWGSSNMSFVNRLERGDLKVAEGRVSSQSSPLVLPALSSPKVSMPSLLNENSDPSSIPNLDLSVSRNLPRTRTPSPEKRHRSTISIDGDAARQVRNTMVLKDFPNYYPLQLKTQDAQFRLLFPNVRRDDRLVLVFRATWNPNDQQDFPGRAYVTTKEVYFYSNHLGLVLTSGVSLASIDEVTAAPGKDCDFLYLHMKENNGDNATRICIKTFLEPLRLLQRRLNFLVRNDSMSEPRSLEDVIKILLKMESEAEDRSPSLESWEEVAPDTPVDGGAQKHRARASTFAMDFRAPTRTDRSLGNSGTLGLSGQGDNVVKFKLPTQPVVYTPTGNLRLAIERQFEVSPKALFHVLFGDKSAVWQLLQHEDHAQNLKQGPWINMGEGRLRRYFDFSIPTSDILGHEQLTGVRDYQVVDVNSDHLCYVVTDKRTAWNLPYREDYRLISKIVITHVAKARCKLAIFVKVEWGRKPWMLQRMIEQHALHDLDLNALDLVDLVSDQVRRLGAHSRTKKAVQIFGHLGQSNEITQLQFDMSSKSIEMRRTPVQRTVPDLMLQAIGTAGESVMRTALEGVFALLKWAYKTCTANAVILLLLATSILYNGWHASADASVWWHEHQAGKFMSRLGVTPDQVMSKAVYVHDLDDLSGHRDGLPISGSNVCYSVFQDAHHLHDLDAPVAMGATNQMQRTRQKLGMYRHDLLVAMRIVNSVEKEVLQSGWQQWVESENRRCRQVEGLLDTNATTFETVARGGAKVKDIQKWYDEYCMSCKEEHDKLVKI